MSIITFVSEDIKETGQTISISAIATAMAIEHNYRILLFSTEFIDKTLENQTQLTNVISKYLKKGGVLVYSTCSILKEENEDIIEEFLKKHKDFKIEKLNIEKNKRIINQEFFKKFNRNNEYLQVYQNEKTDGFFICKLVKYKK